MPLSAGTKLGHYEVVEAIGAGGMGEVYRARDTKLGRDVAIKVLPEEFSQDKERLDRFEREAKLLAALNHPNIATLYGLEKSADTRFLVMELVEGETLAERIARGPIPLDEAILLFVQIAEGLEAAHEKGVIHRDIKPANIKITPEGKVKILDFGLAKGFGEEPPPSNLSESPTVARGTATGVILGTAPYMSPEQARGKPVDKRTDHWAFGCCLYEALTGTTAFLGETVSDTIVKILDKEPDWNALPAGAPNRLLERCLRKDPTRRLQAIGDARIELEEAESEPSDTFAVIPRRRPVVPVLVASIVTALLVWGLMRSEAPVAERVTRTVIPLQADEELAVGDNAAAVAISPDGQYVAYVARGGSSTVLYLRALGSYEVRPVEEADSASMPFFSPDSEWLGFFAEDELRKVSVTGGAPVTIAPAILHRGASWAPDGSIVVSLQNNFLFRVPAEGGEPEPLSVPNRERRERAHRFPDVLPGGKAVLFTLATGDIDSWDEASIAVLSFETGEYRVLLEGGSSGRYSPTGHLVYARAGSLLAAPFDLDQLEVTGAPVPVVEGVETSFISGPAEFGIAGDGSLVYAPGESRADPRTVVWVDRQGRTEPLIDTPRPYWEVRVSPDGRLLALTIEGANLSLWIYDVARGTLSPLARGFHNAQPVWTADGRRLTFNRPGGTHWQAPDGSGLPERLTSHEGPFDSGPWPRSWSPDGKTLAFTGVSAATGSDIGMLSMEGDRIPQAFLQTPFNEAHPRFSPDGRWLAYESDESGQLEIYIRSFPGSEAKRQVSTAGGDSPQWNPRGRELFYLEGDKLMAVAIELTEDLDPVLGKPRMLFERPSLYKYDVAPDGQRFVVLDDSESDVPPKQLHLVQNWAEELKRLVPRDN